LCGALAVLTPQEDPAPVARPLRHPLLACLITFLVQNLHVAVVALVIGETTLGGAGFIIWVPAVAVAAVLWVELHAAMRAATVEVRDASGRRKVSLHDAA
jgi:hypothetical protein